MVISDKNGWPKIDEFMGRFMFILWDMDGKTTKIREMYSENTDGLKGRLFFTSFYEYEKENHDETMFVHMDDPDVEAITELRKEGYITRTRINTETEVDADRYKKALDSGSQIISFGTVLNSSLIIALWTRMNTQNSEKSKP